MIPVKLQKIVENMCMSFLYQYQAQTVTPEGLAFKMVHRDNSKKEVQKKEFNADKPQNQRNWVREEMVVLVAEYFRTKNLSATERKESAEMVSKVLRFRAINTGEEITSTFRNVNGIQMQMACIMKYDPELMREGKGNGLTGGSRLMVEIIKEYLRNPDKIKAEAYDVVMQSNKHFV